jgi:hypothetical protein
MLQPYLPWRYVQQIDTADDMSNTLVVIVDHDGKLVGDQVIFAANNEIA